MMSNETDKPRIPYLSDEWVELMRFTLEDIKEKGLQGGKWISREFCASIFRATGCDIDQWCKVAKDAAWKKQKKCYDATHKKCLEKLDRMKCRDTPTTILSSWSENMENIRSS